MTLSLRIARLLFLAAVCLSTWGLAPTVALSQSAFGRRETKIITWAKGIVRDEAGKPLAGAKVYARATYYSGIRMGGLLHTAVTDAEGRYVIKGEGGLSWLTATLVAHIPGRPPALAWISIPGPEPLESESSPDPPPHDPELDFVIPNRGGKLEVLVSREDKPAADASVALRLEGADPFDNWGRENSSDEHKELLAICRPAAKVGADGIARFDNLLPGLYSIFAVEGQLSAALTLTEYHRWFPFEEPPTYGESLHIPVRTGETSTHHLALFQHGCVTKFEILRDGKNWNAQERVHPSTKSPTGDFETGPTFVGQEWTDVFRYETSGVKLVSFTKYTGTALLNFPYHSADGALAASPRLSNTSLVTLVAQQNNHPAGSVLVRMLDTAGQPIKGDTRVGNSDRRPISLDGTRFSDLQPGLVKVEGYGAGIGSLLPTHLGSMPEPQALINRFEALPQVVTVRDHEETVVTLRFEKVGYVRGRLRAPPGQTPASFELYLGRLDYNSGAGVFYKRDTGDFLAGPYRTGKATLRALRIRGPGLGGEFTETTRVEAGSVTEFDLVVPAQADNEPDAGNLRSKVFLADGQTPAILAVIAKSSLGHPHVPRIGRTDTQGIIRRRSYGYRDDQQDEGALPPDVPPEPFVIAWLPGYCGATFVPLPKLPDQALVITLPAPTHVRARVRVEGEGEIITNGTIRIRAQHEGRGKLDDLLSVENTAGADGSFELAGLTPGKYRVQAALDGIWLSASQTLMVTELKDQPLPPLTLTIPPPGGPVLVRLTPPPHGPPEKLTVIRPTGPLADRLWPKHFTPDGAGVIRIPALEAGKHTLRIGTVENVIEVQPLPISKGAPLIMEWSLAPPPGP